MQEDYLWDKTGHDAEIEQLEETLQMFRYRETAPPVLPFKPAPEQKRSRFEIWRLIYAVPAFGAILLAVFGVWWESSPSVSNLDDFLVELPAVKFVEPAPTGQIPNLAKPTANSPANVTKIKSVQRFAPLKTVAKMSKTKPVKQSPDETVSLTKEEQEAFDRLMLALTITSSKLNIVKEKTRGSEN